MIYPPELHLFILIVIIIAMGSFGGYLNYLHNFDTNKDEGYNKNLIRNKYILLGIGAASLVPAFLKMISSDLIKNSKDFDNNCFLIFGGFCLIASIFSRRFITTIGEKILEAAKNAEITAKQNTEAIENTNRELTSAQERIEDVKTAVTLNNPDIKTIQGTINDQEVSLLKLVDNYIDNTSIPDYPTRLKVKADLGRRMGQIIARHNLSKESLLENNKKEGMYLAIAYAIDLKPNRADLLLLNKISELATQLYTKYVILVAYRTLANTGIIKPEDVSEVRKIINKFKDKADAPLLRNINDTLHVLDFVDHS